MPGTYLSSIFGLQASTTKTKQQWKQGSFASRYMYIQSEITEPYLQLLFNLYTTTLSVVVSITTQAIYLLIGNKQRHCRTCGWRLVYVIKAPRPTFTRAHLQKMESWKNKTKLLPVIFHEATRDSIYFSESNSQPALPLLPASWKWTSKSTSNISVP